MNKAGAAAASPAVPAPGATKAVVVAQPAKKAPSAGGYTVEEVAKHTTKNDCWVILSGKVLNVTSFLSQHPGGELAILTFAGKDATAEFDMIHPPDVIEKYAPDAVIGHLGADEEEVEVEAGGASSGGGSGKAKKAILVPPPHAPVSKENFCLKCFHDTKWCLLKFDSVTWMLFWLCVIFMILVGVSAP